MKKIKLLIVLLLLITSAAFSADFGLLFDREFSGENELFLYNPSLTPWFSWNGSNGASVYFSGNFSFEHNIYSGEMSANNGWKFIPELSRFAFSYQNIKGISFEAGRIYYSDLLGLTACGLLDGLRFSAVTSACRISIGAYYSGLQYKETAKIVMTDGDIANYILPWDFNNFNDYFASRRFLASFRLDVPAGKASAFSFEALVQFDLNEYDHYLNSQYGAVKFDIFPSNMVMISAGAVFEAMQTEQKEFNAAFGALAQLKANLPTAVNDQLGLSIKCTSSVIDDIFTDYIPINSVPQGMIFTSTIAGLTVIGIDYNVRIVKPLYAEFAFNYFMRTINTVSNDNMYGGELWASLVWQPLEDIRITFGGGAFFPKESDVMWKIIGGLTLSF